MKIQDFIALKMIAQDITPRQLAEKTGISSAHLYAIQNGHASPTVERAAKILDVFGYKLTITKKKKKTEE